jgi:glycosyltransferase involved in cell wall biosynthesis
MQPDELVISDDGSSEDIVEGVYDLVDQSKFTVKFVQQEDKGFRLAKCRNNGAREATGDLLVFFDQDLLFSRHYLEILVKHAKPKRFIVGNPIRLTQEQSLEITDEMIKQGKFDAILTSEQRKSTMVRYRKELLYSILNYLRLRRLGPKLRGGIVGFCKSDFIGINGYDENFQGWGNEDDDLGIRFYASGVRGKNPYAKEYALHLYHERFHSGERVNRSYQKQRAKKISKYNFRCEKGFAIYNANSSVYVKKLN